MKSINSGNSIKILFAEDVSIHYLLAVNILKHEELNFHSVCSETREDFQRKLEDYQPDLVVTDFMMPDFNGLDVIEMVNNYDKSIPVIILTGAISEETAVDCMRAGASNYVLKNNLIRLPFAIREALKKKNALLEADSAIQKLKDSESRLNAITNSAGDAIIMIDNRGVISFWNPAAEKVFGYSTEEAVGQVLHSFIVPERYRESHHNHFPAFQRDGTGSVVGKTVELHGTHKSGREIIISLSLSAVKIKNKWNAIGIIRDITEQKKFEMELIHAKERAEAGDRLKSAFINNISHEVRTPLNGILGFSELIVQQDLTPEERDQFKQLIQISSTRLLNTITSYMDISLLMSGNMKLHYKSFSVSKQFRMLFEMFQPLCHVKKLELQLDEPQNITDFVIESDREVHYKILAHLLDNAVKFTSRGVISFGYKTEMDCINYYVRDTGIGIDPEIHDKIFENFRQGEISTTREYEGSGLGLSIARGLARLMGGDITVESVRGQGSLFHCRIPVGVPWQPGFVRVEQPEKHSESKQSLIILLAEDDYPNFLLEERILRKAGFSVIPATNGQEAVEQCKINPGLDLVLMDLKMPVMDGYEATRNIKAFRKDLPVIAITAFAMSGDEKKALEAGCDDYISKPISEKTLLKKIARFGKSIPKENRIS